MSIKKLEKQVASVNVGIEKLTAKRHQVAERIAAITRQVSDSDTDQIARLAQQKAALVHEADMLAAAQDAQERRRDEAQDELFQLRKAAAKVEARQRLKDHTKRLQQNVIKPLEAVEAVLQEIERESQAALRENAQFGTDLRPDDMNFHQLYSGYPGDKLREVIRLFNDVTAQLAKV